MRRSPSFPCLGALAAVAGLLAAGCGQGKWRLVWSDEFNSTGKDADNPDYPLPSSAKWNLEVSGSGFGNQQLEFDTDRPQNVTLDGQGNLAITARAEDFGGNLYTSARINTRGKLEKKYGRFEARIKLPTGRGLWPAFWMLGANIADGAPDEATGAVSWPACGEIDVMEYRGQEPNVIQGSLHGPGYSAGNARTQRFTLPGAAGFDAAFHVFAVEWEPDQIRFYVDGTLYEVTTSTQLPAGTVWVFDHPVYLLLNLAVGGNF
ncbi:MAG TPA: glycoside hydrolase family 16 protein, partial [Solirubrobacterales bacterium]|nr:glycoside hydrolase family 16 protein [Solirubrobacterales bacterium]